MSLFLHLRGRNVDRPLIQELLNQPLYRKMYVAHARTIFEDYLLDGQYKELAERIRSIVRPEIGQEPHALYPPELFDVNYEETVDLDGLEIVGITELLDARAAYLKEHRLIQAPEPVIGQPSVSLSEEEATVSADVIAADVEGEEVKNVFLFYRAGAFHPWKRKAMTASEGSTYTVSLPLEEIADYYLVAEGKNAAAVLPRRSGRDVFSIQDN